MLIILCLIGIIIEYFPPLAFIELWKLVFMDTCLGSHTGLSLWVLCPSVWCFRHQVITFNFWEVTKGNSISLYCLGSLLEAYDQQLESRFLLTGSLCLSSWLEDLWFQDTHHLWGLGLFQDYLWKWFDPQLLMFAICSRLVWIDIMTGILPLQCLSWGFLLGLSRLFGFRV